MAIISWISARRLPTTTPSTQACSCAALLSSTLSSQLKRREIAPCRTACGGWAKKAGYVPSILRMPYGRMSTLRRRWRTRRVSLTKSSAEHLPQRGTPMSSPATKSQMALRAAAAVSGTVLLACLISRVGPGRLLENISTLGWGFVLIVALGGVVHLTKTWAWRLALTDSRVGVSFTRMLQLRLASEAAGQAGALGLVFGEGLRVSALGDNIPVDSR